MNKESGVESDGQELATSMVLLHALRNGASALDQVYEIRNREMVSTGERVTISLLALAPLGIVVVTLMGQFVQWIAREIG